MPIDWRSDTVTRPTEAMRRAMAEAEVGDDVLGDDPTVRRLEEATAALLGKEAAVYMPSGTMCNQVALRTHTEPGDEVLLDAEAHILCYESGAPAALAGVTTRPLPGRRGIFAAADLIAAIRPPGPTYIPAKLCCVENTHNRGGGSIWPLNALAEVAAAAMERGLRLHLDGARLWNATVASGVPEHVYAAPFDTVTVCFSKGLGAPVGSALAGGRELIARARRFRKMYGGGMRQAGIIAAGALYALEHHRERLAEDHARARRLAEALAELPTVELDPATVETNIVIFRLRHGNAREVTARLAEQGVLMIATAPDRIRAVSHLDISDADTAETIAACRRLLG